MCYCSGLRNSESVLMNVSIQGGIKVYLRLSYIRQFTKCLFGKATVFDKISVISQILQNAMHTESLL